MLPGFLGFSVGNFILILMALGATVGWNKCLQSLSGDSVDFNRDRMENGGE